MHFHTEKTALQAVFSVFLFKWFRAGFLLHFLNPAAEFSLFLGGRGVKFSSDSLYIGDVDTTDSGLDFLLDRNYVEDSGITDKRHDLWSYFSFYYRKFGAAHILGSLFQHCGGKTRFL